MKTKLTLIPLLAVSSISSGILHAVPIEWIGNPGDSFFDGANWSDEIGPDPDSNPATPYNGDILFASSSTTVPAKLILGSGYTMTVVDSTLDFGGNGIEGDLASDADSNIILTNSTLSVQSIAIDVNLTADATSTLNLNGAGNPINADVDGAVTPANGTTVSLADGAKIVFVNGNNATNLGAQTIGQRIIRTAGPTTFAADYGTPPLEEFSLAGDQTPFTAPNGGAFTITATGLPVVLNPDKIVGLQAYSAGPPAQNPVWIPTLRTTTNWQYTIDNTNIVNYGWSLITHFFLADLNGDGLDDKLMQQTAISGGAINPAQLILGYTANTPNGFTAGANDQINVPFGWLNASDTKIVFGDMDGDGIDDVGMYIMDTAFGGTLDAYVWGAWKSAGTPGIASFTGTNLAGWSYFGTPSLGDVCMMGDFNGDGIADRLLHRVPDNLIFIDLSVSGTYGDGVADYGPLALGMAGDKLLVTDINGDGLDDLVLARDTSTDPLYPTPGLQTLYGYFNDGNGFASLDGAQPDIVDFWGVNDGVLFGKVPGPDLSNFKITQVTSAGPNADFVGTFNAPVLWNYRIEASLDLQAPWVEVGNYTNVLGSVPFTVTDAVLDTAFPATTDPRPKVFLRTALLPAP